MKFEYWFPTVTCVHDVEEHLRNSIKNTVDDWSNSEHYDQYIKLCEQDNLYTSYFSRNDILGDLGLEDLRNEIQNVASAFIFHYGLEISPTDLRVDSWINFFKPGQSEQQHNHYGNFLSGVYYIHAPEKTGVYRFYDPAAQKVMWRGAFLNNAKSGFNNVTSSDYNPKNGMLIIFPSWLDHCVMTNKSDETRISLAFNVNVRT